MCTCNLCSILRLHGDITLDVNARPRDVAEAPLARARSLLMNTPCSSAAVFVGLARWNDEPILCFTLMG